MWPFTKREDWREAASGFDRRWITVREAGEYVEQTYCVREVRFPDGATRWTPRCRDGYSTRVVTRVSVGE